jgi:ribonucleotide monophosphatase NagD (HAD superfamily)
MKTLAIDFDGVLHKYSKGWHDGTIYDEPIWGAREALEVLSQNYKLVVYTNRASDDKGIELVSMWLQRYDMLQFIEDITDKKQLAIALIDDRAIRFRDWNQTLEDITIWYENGKV